VQRVAREGNDAERTPATHVVAGQILFVDQLSVSLDQDGVHVVLRVRADRFRHLFEATAVDARVLRRTRLPAVPDRGRNGVGDREIGRWRGGLCGRGSRQSGERADEDERRVLAHAQQRSRPGQANATRGRDCVFQVPAGPAAPRRSRGRSRLASSTAERVAKLQV
jgi:hypothetical protein